jgi:hypothetical protein
MHMALVVTNESLAAGMLPVVMPIGVTSDEVIAATASGVYDVSRDAAKSTPPPRRLGGSYDPPALRDSLVTAAQTRIDVDASASFPC